MSERLPKQSGGKKPLNKNQLLKRNRIRNARSIRAEAVAASSSKHASPSDLSESGGKLKVDQFMNSRQFEVNQLQLAMHNSKGASSTRIFQALPRKLRRRTASHNVRRIPKRMRNRALREMRKSDQQQTLKNSSASSRKTHGLNAKQLYRAKMSIKLLRLASKSTSMKLGMPLDITSSKCHVRQKIKSLKRMIKESSNPNSNIIRLNNRMGSYDTTGLNELASTPKGRIKYTKRQKHFAWLPTHIWNAKRSHMIKRWGYQVPWAPTQKCFKLTHRLGGDTCASDGALCLDSSHIGTIVVRDSNSDTKGEFLKSIIGKLTSGRASLNKYRRSQTLFQGLIYSFSENSPRPLGPCDIFWIQDDTVVLRLHPSIFTQVFEIFIQYIGKLTIQDCRYSLASITLKGAKALESLASCLRSTKHCTSFEQFKDTSKITDHAILPQRCTFAFEAIDPRHLAAPKKLNDSQRKTYSSDDILSLQVNYPQSEINSVLKQLCDPDSRTRSYNNQNTLKEISARRSELLATTPNHINKTTIPFKENSDPSIPLVIMRRPKTSDWIVMLPWFWLLPLWHQLNRIPRVYHIGLRQFQQIQYENEQLYFPDDYPFTQLGYVENSFYKREASKTKWDRKPKGKKINFERVKDIHHTQLPAYKGEIGDFFSSDWRFLQILKNGLDYLQCDDKDLKLMDSKKTGQFGDQGIRIINCLNDVLEFHKDYETKVKAEPLPVEENVPITLCKLSKCQTPPKTINSNTSSLDLSIQPRCTIAISCRFLERGHPKDNARIYRISEEHLDHWMQVAEGVYRSNGRKDHDLEIPLPEVHDLIGFITSGTYHLNSGNGMGIGFIDHHSAIQQSARYVLIRNVGTNIYRLAKWSEISV
ncbi:ribonuclease P/MRP protein subunit POP1 [Saccharomyces eubayanus]|uniref:ribonuclease P/MRP protein subunit POP1 n=1 Tax=Saccharomyces eubayanus TaxID=1080349 RepID=UPI0006BF78C8|nr:POP1-like protein [Saccharomyces eubayanus]KOG96951.1 POP1-like protein [Saccharomyces eubayanus]